MSDHQNVCSTLKELSTGLKSLFEVNLKLVTKFSLIMHANIRLHHAKQWIISLSHVVSFMKQIAKWNWHFHRRELFTPWIYLKRFLLENKGKIFLGLEIIPLLRQGHHLNWKSSTFFRKRAQHYTMYYKNKMQELMNTWVSLLILNMLHFWNHFWGWLSFLCKTTTQP